MKPSRILTCALLGAALVLAPSLVPAQQPWDRDLQGGGQIHIDPETGKGRITTRRGAETMLWDGVHKLEDGSTIIVRDGVVVPDKPMAEARLPAPETRPTEASPCKVLERKVCGLEGQCEGTEPCRLARQLVGREDGDRGADRVAALEETLSQCREALDLESFPACPREETAKRSSPCRSLAERVCGPQGQCAGGQACNAARQLVDMEHDERLHAPDPDAATETADQCREAAADTDFFAPCRESGSP